MSVLHAILLPRFVYEEEEGAITFFCPYVWALVRDKTAIGK
jgi:hypothetical protein